MGVFGSLWLFDVTYDDHYGAPVLYASAIAYLLAAVVCYLLLFLELPKKLNQISEAGFGKALSTEHLDGVA